FLLDTAANIIGIVVILMIAKMLGPWGKSALAPRSWQATKGAISTRAKHFLLLFTLGPLGLAIIAALLSHAGLKTAWGSSMFNTAGVLAIALTTERYTSAGLRRIALCAAFLLVVVPLGYAAVVKFDAHQSSGTPLRVN